MVIKMLAQLVPRDMPLAFVMATGGWTWVLELCE